jgi:hypothetical protein
MSTRGLITFVGETGSDTWNVYKHHDMYPKGAAHTLRATLKHFSWMPPRYESDEFAASFIAAAKAEYYLRYAEAKDAKARKLAMEYTGIGKYGMKGGGVRLMPQGAPLTIACQNCSDIEYRYEIFQGNEPGVLRVRAYAVNAWEEGTESLFADMPLSEFLAKDWSPSTVLELAEKTENNS